MKWHHCHCAIQIPSRYRDVHHFFRGRQWLVGANNFASGQHWLKETVSLEKFRDKSKKNLHYKN